MNGIAIAAGRVLAEPGHRPALRDMAIAVADGRIAAIAPAEPTAASRGLLAMPALVNAHDHGYGLRPIAFGAVDDALEPWISGLGARPPADPYLEAAVAFARMALGGIGTATHCHNSLNADRLVEEAGSVARAAADVGIRVAFCCPILDRNAWVYGGVEAVRPLYSPELWQAVADWVPRYADAEPQLAAVDEIADAYQSNSFSVQYGPIGPQWCKDRTLEKIAEASARTGRRVHMHLLESRRQREWTDHTYDGGIVRHLDRIGLLSPRLAVAHGVWLNEDECALLAERGVTVVVNSCSNLRLRSGLAPLPSFLRHGIRVALGLDGMAFDDAADALQDLRLTYLLHAGTDLEPALSHAALFDAACRHGGFVFDGDGGRGRLAPGRDADIVCLDYGAMSADVLAESADELAVLVSRMRAGYLTDLYVAGRPVVRDRRLATVDLDDLETALGRAAARHTDRLAGEAPARNEHREITRRYYREGRHLARAGGPGGSGGDR